MKRAWRLALAAAAAAIGAAACQLVAGLDGDYKEVPPLRDAGADAGHDAGHDADSNGNPICTDLGFAYQMAKSSLCGGLDILKDGTGAPSTPCDALSIGLGFTAEEAKLGAVAPPPTPTPGYPAATDPTNDHCQ